MKKTTTKENQKRQWPWRLLSDLLKTDGRGRNWINAAGPSQTPAQLSDDWLHVLSRHSCPFLSSSSFSLPFFLLLSSGSGGTFVTVLYFSFRSFLLGFQLRPTNGFLSGYPGFSIHLLGCLKLDAFCSFSKVGLGISCSVFVVAVL